MKKFYKVNDSKFVEIDFVDTISEWQAYLIDVEEHKAISMFIETDKIKLIANIVGDNWFKSDINNFAIFLEDILKY